MDDDIPEMKENVPVEQEEDFMGITDEDNLSILEEPPIEERVVQDKKPSEPEQKPARRERESISKWFNSQFGGLFTDEDTEVK